MTVAKVRNLSQFGVVTDVDPFNLPANAWSMAVNARFEGQSVLRAPVFRRVPLTLSQSNPRFLTSNFPASGFDTLYIGYLNGRVSKFVSATETDVSIAGFVNNSADVPFTSVNLQQVLYVNRNDRVPWKLANSDTQFVALAGGWDATWRANLLRQCGGALVALGVTKGGNSFPTMVKTSNFAQVNSIPTTWDQNDPTNNATENELGDMTGPIIEAQNLGSHLVIYGLQEAWIMTADQSQEVFRYDKLPFAKGCVSANCAIEVENKHYVFGKEDIWVHDGTTADSIVDDRVRKFIFGSINISQSSYFHVKYDPNRKEIRFNYVSGDGFCDFVAATGTGCNRSAVYSIVHSTWTFDDIPFVFGSAQSNVDTSLTWASVTTTWDMTGGTWLDQEDSKKRILVMVGDVNSTYSLSESLYAVDLQGPGSTVAFPVDTHATRSVRLYRDGIDLDELPEVVDNRGYKVVNSIFPQGRFEPAAQPLQFSFGSADHYNDSVVFSAPQTFDGGANSRCDFYSGGRFLSMKIVHDDWHYFNFTGLDIDLQVTGQES